MKYFDKNTVVGYVNDALTLADKEIIVLYASGSYEIMDIENFDPSNSSVVHYIKGDELNIIFSIPEKELKKIGTGYIKEYPSAYNRSVNTVLLRANMAVSLFNS